MSTEMKAQLFLYNGISIATYLAWLGYFFLKSLGRAFANANHSSGPGDVGWVFVVAGIATAACAVYSFFAPANIAKTVALAPLGLVLLGYGFIGYSESANRAHYARDAAARKAAGEKKLSGTSKDYVRNNEDLERYDNVKLSFLTQDRELHALVLIDVGYQSEISAFGIGKISGNHLDTLERVDEKYYGQYRDAEGKTIFDRYTLRHTPELKDFDFHLEKYKP